MTSIEDAVKLVLHTAKLSGSRVVAEFNGFILDSKNSYDKNLDLYWAYMGRADRNVNWEQRRYEIAKTMLPASTQMMVMPQGLTTRQSTALSTRLSKAAAVKLYASQIHLSKN